MLLSVLVRRRRSVGDRFTVLNRGQSMGTFEKGEIKRDELETMMAGGEEFERLEEQLEEETGEQRPSG